VFLRAALGLAPMRDVLQQHGVQTARAWLDVGDRDLHVARRHVAAQDLRGAALGRLGRVRCPRERPGVSKMVRRRGAQLVERRADEALRLRVRVEDAARVGSNSTMPERARSKMAR
jgi:hypothetical protein